MKKETRLESVYILMMLFVVLGASHLIGLLYKIIFN